MRESLVYCRADVCLKRSCSVPQIEALLTHWVVQIAAMLRIVLSHIFKGRFGGCNLSLQVQTVAITQSWRYASTILGTSFAFSALRTLPNKTPELFRNFRQREHGETCQERSLCPNASVSMRVRCEGTQSRTSGVARSVLDPALVAYVMGWCDDIVTATCTV